MLYTHQIIMGGRLGYSLKTTTPQKKEPKYDSAMDAFKVFRAQKIEERIKDRLRQIRGKLYSKTFLNPKDD